MRILGISSGYYNPAPLTFEYLGNMTPVTATTGGYTSFSSTFTNLSSGGTGTYIAVIQSRDASQSTTSPIFSLVTIGGVTATRLERTVNNVNDYNISAIALLSNVSFSSTCSVAVSINATHEGQANIYLYRVYSNDIVPTTTKIESMTPTSTSVSATNSSVGISNSTNILFAVASTSNTASAWTPTASINGSSQSLTTNFSGDTGTTEFTTIATAKLDTTNISSFSATASGVAPVGGAGAILGVLVSFPN